MTSWSRWVLAHKRVIAGFWLVVAIAGYAALQPAADALTQEFSVPGREGFETNREIAAVYGNGGNIVPIVPVVTLPEGTTVDSPGVAEELDAALARVQAALPEARVASYASTSDPAFVSKDGRTTFALVYVPHEDELERGQREAQLAQAALDDVTVAGAAIAVTGLDALRATAAGESAGSSVRVLVEVLVAGAGALIVLAFVFASLMAIVPLLMAAIAIPTTFLLVWPLAEVTDVSIAVQYLVALIGLGIAIDYALLVVVRWREEHRQNGVGNEAAVERAMQRAGSAVVFSGTTVAIALLALVALPVPVLRTIGIGGLLVALVSVAVATTVLPVLLATVGPRLDWPRGRREDRASRAWTAWARGRGPPSLGRRRSRHDRSRRPGRRRLLDPARHSQGRVARAVGARACGAPAARGFGDRPRAARALRRARARRRSRRCGREARRGRRRAGRGCAAGLAPRRDGTRHGRPDHRRKLARRPRNAGPPPRRREASPGGGRDRRRGRPRAPTGSTPSTATSR